MTVTRASTQKAERNEEIINRVIKGRGDVSLKELGDEYGLTRARIQHIVGEAGISMRAIKRTNKKAILLQCNQCPRVYPKGTYSEHCREAGHRRLTPPGEKIERNAEVVRKYVKGGYNTSEIAKYFDIPQPVVTRILHRAGIRAEGRRRAKGGLAPGGYLNGHS